MVVALSCFNKYENTFGLVYGYKIPFIIAKNRFNFYPKAGIHISNISSIPEPEGNELDKLIINLPRGTPNPDTLYVTNRELNYRNTNLFVSAGFELETVLIYRIRLFWQNLYNYSLGNSGYYKIGYYFESDPTLKQQEITLSLSNFNSIIGIRFPF